MTSKCITNPDRLAFQLRGLFVQQIECALEELGREQGQNALQIHAARKQLKKARATLRLLRFALGKKAFRRENRIVRDVARPLSGPRDAEVLMQTFESLTSRLKDDGCTEDFRSLRRALETHCRKIAQAREIDESPEDIRETLRDVQRRSRQWKIRSDDWQIVSRGLIKTYRQGRAQFTRARVTPSVEHLHDWRKRARYLWHQLQMLTPIAEGPLGESSDQFHRLSDYLGDDHDLAVLGEVLRTLEIDSDAPESAALFDRLSRQRIRLRERAFALGKRLYSRSPKQLRKEIDVLWNEYQSSERLGEGADRT